MLGSQLPPAAAAGGLRFGVGSDGSKAGFFGAAADLTQLIADVPGRPGGLDRVGVAQVQQPTVRHAAHVRAVWHQALAALGPVDGPDVRGMPDGRLLHLRDTYPIETAWAPRYVGDELRQVRGAAWNVRLAGLRAAAEARAVGRCGDHDHAAAKHKLAAGYQALEQAYRQRETVFAAVMTDRAWEAATRQPPKPEMPPSPRILQHAMDRDAE